MKCELCGQDAAGLICLRVYTSEGIKVCEDCYRAIDSHLHKPYSKLMDRLAMVEAGYQVNRKLAKIRKQI